MNCRKVRADRIGWVLLGLLLGGPSLGQLPSLVGDVAPPNAVGQAAAALAVVGDRVLFSTSTSLWESDGSVLGTRAVVSTETSPPVVVGGYGGSVVWVQNIQWSGDQLFLLDRDGDSSQVLVDGEPLVLRPGLRVVLELEGGLVVLGRTPSRGPVLVAIGESGVAEVLAQFERDDAVDFETDAERQVGFVLIPTDGGMEVWRTDASLEGTERIASFDTGPSVARAGDQIVLVGYDRVWAFDAGEAHPEVRLLTPPDSFSVARSIQTSGERVWFLARTEALGEEWWTSDGTTGGTRRVTSFTDPFPFADGNPGTELVDLGTTVLFRATVPGSGGEGGYWIADPTRTGVMQRLRSDQGQQLEGRATRLAPFDDGAIVVTQLQDSGATDVWNVDRGGVAHHRGRLCSWCFRTPTLRPFGSLVALSMLEDPTRSVWVATSTSLRRLRDGLRGQEPDVAVAGGKAYYSWTSQEGTAFVEVVPLVGGEPRSLARITANRGPLGLLADLQASPSGLVYTAPTGQGRQVVFVGQGGIPVTLPIPPLSGGVVNEHGRSLLSPIAVGEHVLAVSSRPAGHPGLAIWSWSADGTVEILAGNAGESGAHGLLIAGVDGAVFGTLEGEDIVLWTTDGTAAGTRHLTSMPRWNWNDGVPVLPVDGAILAVINRPPAVDLVRIAPGQVTTIVQLSPLGGLGPDPVGWVAFEDWFALRFSGRVFLSDGTAAGTRVVDVQSGGASYPTTGLVRLGDRLLGLASRPVGFGPLSDVLFAIDGRLADPQVIATFSDPFRSIAQAHDLTTAGPFAYFAAPSQSGSEPWITDGTVAGTQPLGDLAPGPLSSEPAGFTETARGVVFSAFHPTFGRELWRSDGSGLKLVHDLRPGADSSSPHSFQIHDGKVFFGADDGLVDDELWALPLSGPAGCVASPTQLCVGDGRFRVEARWHDFSGGAGSGKSEVLTSDTGYFWFFSQENIEVVLKVLDGRVLNDHHWVFYGALSNVEYDLTVSDTQTGLTRRYHNPSGTFASIGDTAAFGPHGASLPTPVSVLMLPSRTRMTKATGDACESGANVICLGGGRFAVRVTWRDFSGGSGEGSAVELTNDSGYFWFFSPDNVELIVKVLDGRPVNGRFWVFAGALSNVEYHLSVTDLETGISVEYDNPSGRFLSFGDTEAF